MMVHRPFDEDDERWRRFQVGIAVLVALLGAGTVAFRLLGLGWLDAFYQTIITITTVGFSEIPPESGEIGPGYRLVSSLLVLFGVAIGAYTLGVFFEALLEGRLTARLGRVRMQRELDRLTDHVIVCGYGQVGQAITAAILEHGVAAAIVDRSPTIHEDVALPTVHGDATDDDALRQAGVERARGLVVALDTDADNLFVTISARTLNPSLFIVARANETSSVDKLAASGADRVVNPHQIGGARMASFMVQPNVADFVGESMSDDRFEVRLAETQVTAGSPLAGRSIEASGVTSACGVVILAVRRPDGSFVHQPPPATVPELGDVLITLGTPDQHAALQSWVQHRPVN